jgi:hypothetical protein
VKSLVATSLILLSALPGRAGANIRVDEASAWSANIGWIQWRTDAANGVQISEYICSGFLYSANVGWISVGNGRPANGVQYQNKEASDFGVNVDPEGNLHGLAYGANIGWINFEETGAPRIDLETGKLSGFAYGANVGWISLGDASFGVRVESISSGEDSDQDGIPDAWEITQVGNLKVMDRLTDSDQDGHGDRDEYLGDTDPFNPDDFLRITQVTTSAEGNIAQLTWTARSTRRYKVQSRSSMDADSPWIELDLPQERATGTSLSSTLADLPPSARNFFRIQAMRPLAPE